MSNTNDALQHGQDSANQAMSGIKDGIAQATAHASAGMEQAQVTMRDSMEKAMKTAQDVMSFSQGNIDALTKASQIFATGMQDMIHSVTTSSKASMDDAMNTIKAMGGVKSVREAMDLQSTLVRSTLEKAVAQSSQLTDSSMKLSERTLAPITARVSLATETFGRAH